MEMQRQKDGTEIERVKYDFIGRHICLGDIGVLEARGVDSGNCPECEASTESDAVRSPERRFAMHVIRYGTQPGGFQVATPFSVNLLAWAYGDNIYNKLADAAAEWGDLTKRDLLLGPCTVAQYQKFDIAVAAQAAWMQDESTQQLTVTTFRENQCKDLQSLIARKVDRQMMEQDLETVVRRYKQAYGTGSSSAADANVTAGEMSTAIDLDALLNGPSVDADTAISGGVVEHPATQVEDVKATQVEDVKATPEAAPKAEEPALDFDDLLANL